MEGAFFAWPSGRTEGTDGSWSESTLAPTKERKKPGRKPVGDEPPASKRLAQTRAAQRAFRERKKQYVENLEARVASLEHALAVKDSEILALHNRVADLETRLGRKGEDGNGWSSVVTNGDTEAGESRSNESTPITHPDPSHPGGQTYITTNPLQPGQNYIATDVGTFSQTETALPPSAMLGDIQGFETEFESVLSERKPKPPVNEDVILGLCEDFFVGLFCHLISIHPCLEKD